MKKFLMIVSVMMFSMTSFAQVGKTTFGAHFNYMIDSPNNAGLGATMFVVLVSLTISLRRTVLVHGTLMQMLNICSVSLIAPLSCIHWLV